MKGNALVTGMFSGLLSGLLVAFVSTFITSASISTDDIPLHDLRGAEQVFVAPFSGEAILTGEFESTGCLLWGSILVTHEAKDQKKYKLIEASNGECGEAPLNSLSDPKPFKYPQVSDHSSDELLTIATIQKDKNILCHVVDVGMKTGDNVRPARINLNCPLMELKQGERYVIRSHFGDKGGSVDRFGATVRYIYRKPRLPW